MTFGPGPDMLINGPYLDLGDDFISYISIIDEYHDQGGELNKTIRQEPFSD
jgi:hypothetical protein